MKLFRRIISLLIVLSFCFPAALAESPSAALWKAVNSLFFETENVTLTADAAFSVDGLLFKSFNGIYKQDGVNTTMTVSLDTPNYYTHKTHSGWYTVIANGQDVYVFESGIADGKAYYESNRNAGFGTTILNQDGITEELYLLNALVSVASPLLDTVITGEKGIYSINYKSGEVPAFISAAVGVAAREAAWRYFGVGDYYFSYPSENFYFGNEGLIIYDDDWEAPYREAYQAIYNNSMPENFWSIAPEAVIDKLTNYIEDSIYAPLREQYTKGAILRYADGSYAYFETLSEFYIANNEQFVDSVDYRANVRQWYLKQTGNVLTEADQEAIYLSDNIELIDAYYTMCTEMDAYYQQLAKESGACGIIVDADGTVTPILNYEAYIRDSYDYPSRSRELLKKMNNLQVDSLDFTFSMDEEGHIVGADGTVTLIFDGGEKVTITGNAAAFDYGTTHIAQFDPAENNVVNANEYWENYYKQPDEEPAPAPLPETIVFDGVEYRIIIG